MASSTPTLDSAANELERLKVSDDIQTLEEEAELEAPEEETERYAESDVPHIIKSLYSENEDEREQGIKALGSISTNQPELIAHHIPDLIPSILKFAPTLSDETRRSELLDLLSQVGSKSTAASHLLQQAEALEEVVRLLRRSDTMDKYSLVNLLEETLERSAENEGGEAFATFERILVGLLQDEFYSPELSLDKDEAAVQETPTKALLNAIEVFDLTLVLTKTYLRSASLEAGAIEFLVLISTTPDETTGSSLSPTTSTEVRLAALSCLAEVYSRVVDDELTPSDVPQLEMDPNQKIRLQGFILIPILDLVEDEDESVSDKAVEVLYGRINDEDQAVTQFFSAYDGSLEKLIHKLASSGKGLGGEGVEGSRDQHSLTEWLLSVLISRDSDGVNEALASFWANDAIESSTKENLVAILPNTLSNIQGVAERAGISINSTE